MWDSELKSITSGTLGRTEAKMVSTYPITK